MDPDDMAEQASMSFDDVGEATGYLIHQATQPSTFLSVLGYEEGYWRGREYKDMEFSHLENCKAMCLRFKNEANHPENAQAFENKANEINEYLLTRPRAIITQHEFRITEEDIIKWAKAYGVRLPKSGAGVYSGPRASQRRIPEMFLRWDTSKTVKAKR